VSRYNIANIAGALVGLTVSVAFSGEAYTLAWGDPHKPIDSWSSALVWLIVSALAVVITVRASNATVRYLMRNQVAPR
jgi:hypothetical protein